jgi:hypothetical protein
MRTWGRWHLWARRRARRQKQSRGDTWSVDGRELTSDRQHDGVGSRQDHENSHCSVSLCQPLSNHCLPAPSPSLMGYGRLDARLRTAARWLHLWAVAATRASAAAASPHYSPFLLVPQILLLVCLPEASLQRERGKEWDRLWQRADLGCHGNSLRRAAPGRA